MDARETTTPRDVASRERGATCYFLEPSRSLVSTKGLAMRSQFRVVSVLAVALGSVTICPTRR